MTPALTMAKNLLEETLDAWGYARDGVIDELENIPATEYNFRPSPHSRSTAELAAHIIESGLMASGELTRKDGNFQRQSYPEFIDEYGGDRAKTTKKAELVTLLRTTFDEGVAAFRKSGEKAMMQPIVQFNGEPATRLTWLNHAIAHEEYHRGQLALYARLLGHVPALTKLIDGSG
jgi:uncharacterized damage-inducible protein DinB